MQQIRHGHVPTAAQPQAAVGRPQHTLLGCQRKMTALCRRSMQVPWQPHPRLGRTQTRAGTRHCFGAWCNAGRVCQWTGSRWSKPARPLEGKQRLCCRPRGTTKRRGLLTRGPGTTSCKHYRCCSTTPNPQRQAACWREAPWQGWTTGCAEGKLPPQPVSRQLWSQSGAVPAPAATSQHASATPPASPLPLRCVQPLPCCPLPVSSLWTHQRVSSRRGSRAGS